MKAHAITARGNNGGSSNNRKDKRKSYSHPTLNEKDPNAMDVDAVRLSREDRDKYLKEGCCFNCGNKGHMSRECKGKQPAKGVKKVVKEEEESEEEGGVVSVIKATKFLKRDF